MDLDVATLNRDVERETLTLKRVEAELRRVIVGQDYLLDRLLVGLLSRGHVLIEGVPGLAKTLAVKTGEVIDGQWRVDQIHERGLNLTWLPAKLTQSVNFRAATP